jgi:hypothetical protein
MLLDIGAWALILGIAYLAGDGVLALLGAHGLRRGDRSIIAAWCGVVILALVLLAVSLAAPLSPVAGAACAILVGGGGAALRHRFGRAHRRHKAPDPLSAPSIAFGVAVIFVGAAALASDRVTLYDSLVYHLGVIRWLREHGTVPGVALIHNRLGHVSAWFALDAPFDSGIAAGRAGNIALGVALVLVALQGAVAAMRIAGRRANGADWFLLLSSTALVWPVVRFDVASPSPDVATNALIIVVAWSMLIVPRAPVPSRTSQWLSPRLVPFVLAAGATAMKLFALPAAGAAALFYAFAPADDRGPRVAAGRLAICAAVGLALTAPLLAANTVTSGCPLFPSPIACTEAGWSVGRAQAADYAEYIRNVARFETRSSFERVAGFPWVGPWISAHPLITCLVILAPVIVVVLLRGPRRDGVRSALLVAVLGVAFALSQAPAPRFLYAYVIIAPGIFVAYWLASRLHRRAAQHVAAAQPPLQRAAAIGFAACAVIAGGAYALASQKLNVRTSAAGASPLFVVDRHDLLIPAAPEVPQRLYRWRVNDVDVLTPVPRPVADTLSYRSVVDGDAGLEKCSTAPLPCTPYLPPSDLTLRVPSRGLAAGFVRDRGRAQLSAAPRRCVGEIVPPFATAILGSVDLTAPDRADRCRAAPSRDAHREDTAR